MSRRRHCRNDFRVINSKFVWRKQKRIWLENGKESGRNTIMERKVYSSNKMGENDWKWNKTLENGKFLFLFILMQRFFQPTMNCVSFCEPIQFSNLFHWFNSLFVNLICFLINFERFCWYFSSFSFFLFFKHVFFKKLTNFKEFHFIHKETSLFFINFKGETWFFNQFQMKNWRK